MKILLNKFAHYFEVVFPILADRFGWMFRYPIKLQTAIFKMLKIDFVWKPTKYNITKNNLKRILDFCELLTAYPQMFNKIVTDFQHVPMKFLKQRLKAAV